MRAKCRLAAAVADKNNAIEALNEVQKDCQDLTSTCVRLAAQNSRLREIVAEHIDAAGRPEVAHCDATSAAIALREALEAAGFDLSFEFADIRHANGDAAPDTPAVADDPSPARGSSAHPNPTAPEAQDLL